MQIEVMMLVLLLISIPLATSEDLNEYQMNADSNNPLSLEPLRREGCVPDDFASTVRHMMDHCWTLEQDGYGRMTEKTNKAYLCVAKSLQLIDNEPSTIAQELIQLINRSLIAPPGWIAAQRQSTLKCVDMMEADGMEPEQRAVYVLSCLHGMMKLQCRRNKVLRLTGPNAVQLISIMNARCLRRLKIDLNTTVTWTSCVPRELTTTIASLIHIVDDLVNAGDQATPAQRDQLHLLAEQMYAVQLCTMKGSGKVRSNNTINYEEIRKRTTISYDCPAYTKRLRLVNRCENSGATSVSALWHCWLSNAPEFCVADNSHRLFAASVD